MMSRPKKETVGQAPAVATISYVLKDKITGLKSFSEASKIASKKYGDLPLSADGSRTHPTCKVRIRKVNKRDHRGFNETFTVKVWKNKKETQ